MRPRIRMATRLLAVLTVVAGVGGGPAYAQRWYFETQAGRVRPDFAPVDEPEGFLSGLRNVMVGTRYEHGPGGFRVSAGIPTRSDEPLWGALGGWHRFTPLELESWFAGVDLAGNGYLVRERGTGPGSSLPLPGDPVPSPGARGHALAGQVLPVVGYQRARFQVQARSGMSFYSSRLGSTERDNRVWLSDAQSMASPFSWLALGPVVRHYRTSQDAHTYAGGNGVVRFGVARAWAEAGRWLDPGGSDIPWAAGGSVRLHPRMAVNVSRRRETFDPLYLRQPQTSWSVGLSIQIGGPLNTTRAVPVAAFEGGRVTIRLAARDSSSIPRIAGDFNDWQPQVMLRTGDHWAFTASVAPGVYNYAFVNEEGEWFVPESAPGRRADGMGGYVAVLVVPS